MWERKRAAMGMDRKVQVEEWLEGKLKEAKKVDVTLKGPSVPKRAQFDSCLSPILTSLAITIVRPPL